MSLPDSSTESLSSLLLPHRTECSTTDVDIRQSAYGLYAYSRKVFPFSFTHRILLVYCESNVMWWIMVPSCIICYLTFVAVAMAGLSHSGFTVLSAVRLAGTYFLFYSSYIFCVYQAEYFVQLKSEFRAAAKYERWLWFLMLPLGGTALMTVYSYATVLLKRGFYFYFWIIPGTVLTVWNLGLNLLLICSWFFVNSRNFTLLQDFQTEIQQFETLELHRQNELPLVLLSALHRIERTSAKFQWWSGLFSSALTAATLIGVPPDMFGVLTPPDAKINFFGNSAFIYLLLLLMLVPPVRVTHAISNLTAEIQKKTFVLSQQTDTTILRQLQALTTVENFKPSIFGFTLTGQFLVQLTGLYFSFVVFLSNQELNQIKQ